MYTYMKLPLIFILCPRSRTLRTGQNKADLENQENADSYFSVNLHLEGNNNTNGALRGKLMQIVCLAISCN